MKWWRSSSGYSFRVFSETDLETYLYRHIPLSRAMGIKVLTASANEVRLAVPLEPNMNHRRTAFGGSVSASAILAGWSLLFMRLLDHTPRPELVIQANRLQYIRPIVCDFEVSSVPIDGEAWAAFEQSLQRKGRGRIHAHSVIESKGERCCEFSGTFVALQKES